MPIYGTPAPVNRFPFIETFDPTQTDAVTGTVGANALRMTRLPRLAKRMTTSNASIYVFTASGNFDIAVLTTTDGGTTLTRVASTGSTVATPTNDIQTVALAVAWEPDKDYWAAISADNGTLAVLRVNNPATNYANLTARPKMTGSAASSFPVPASLATHTWGFASKYYVLFD